MRFFSSWSENSLGARIGERGEFGVDGMNRANTGGLANAGIVHSSVWPLEKKSQALLSISSSEEPKRKKRQRKMEFDSFSPFYSSVLFPPLLLSISCVSIFTVYFFCHFCCYFVPIKNIIYLLGNHITWYGKYSLFDVIRNITLLRQHIIYIRGS